MEIEITIYKICEQHSEVFRFREYLLNPNVQVIRLDILKGVNMAETQSHKQGKERAPGKTEVQIRGGRRLDSKSDKTATEIERSSNQQRLEKAARRLRDSGVTRRVLVVPQPNMPKATKAMRKVGTTGTVKNLSGTRRTSVRKNK